MEYSFFPILYPILNKSGRNVSLWNCWKTQNLVLFCDQAQRDHWTLFHSWKVEKFLMTLPGVAILWNEFSQPCIYGPKSWNIHLTFSLESCGRLASHVAECTLLRFRRATVNVPWFDKPCAYYDAILPLRVLLLKMHNPKVIFDLICCVIDHIRNKTDKIYLVFSIDEIPAKLIFRVNQISCARYFGLPNHFLHRTLLLFGGWVTAVEWTLTKFCFILHKDVNTSLPPSKPVPVLQFFLLSRQPKRDKICECLN